MADRDPIVNDAPEVERDSAHALEPGTRPSPPAEGGVYSNRPSARPTTSGAFVGAPAPSGAGRVMGLILARIVLPLAVIGVGAYLGMQLIASRETAERRPEARTAPSVEVRTVSAEAIPVRVRGTGVIEPAREITIVPEISGRVIEVAPQMRVSGRVEQGQVLLRIDARSYALLTRSERNRVAQAKVELELEQGRGDLAAREWELLMQNRERVTSGRGVGGPSATATAPVIGAGAAPTSDTGRRIALREPQKEAAKIGLATAESSLARAQLDKSRAVIRAPFNATVTSEAVEVGQVVGPSSRVATLIGTDFAFVRVAVPVDELVNLRVPGMAGIADGEGSEAEVRLRTAGSATVRAGKVIGLVGQLEPQTRRAQVIVEIERPFDAKEDEIPLIPGAFVDVEILGRAQEGVFVIPRGAVFEGDQVWIVDREDRLARRSVDITWREADSLWISDGLNDGERLVVGPIVMPVLGMRVRPQVEAPRPGEPASAAPAKVGAPSGTNTGDRAEAGEP